MYAHTAMERSHIHEQILSHDTYVPYTPSHILVIGLVLLLPIQKMLHVTFTMA